MVPKAEAPALGLPDLEVLPREHLHARQGGICVPDDLLEQALLRLWWIGLFLGGMAALSVISNVALYMLGVAIPLPPISLAARGGALVAAMLLHHVIRTSTMDRRIKVDIGLAFEIFVSLALAVTEVIMLAEMQFPMGAISIVSLWMLVFHLIVPTPSIKTLIAVGLSAFCVPAAQWLSQALGHPAVEPVVALALYKTTAGAALVAWLASRGMYRLGTAVSAARQMGSYRLEYRLGQGGMGEVWRASHAMLKRPAAIKLIRPANVGELGTPERTRAIERFEREAQATANLSSPHSVNLFDFGATLDHSFYYVMELLDGLDLESLVSRYGPVPPERCALFLVQACHSLMDAHAHNLIHRDIKPANLFVCRLGPDYDFIKILDFGLVKTTELPEADAVQLTQDGLTPGTPAFMSPEIALGKREIDARADLYSLGCVGYWLLTGDLVFSGENPISIITQHVHETPALVSERTELDVPADFEAVIMDCLQKDPGERPQSAGELRRRLESCSFARPWDQERASKWWRAHQPTAESSSGKRETAA